MLAGGSTLFPGIAERLRKEMAKLDRAAVSMEIEAPPERKFSAWLGGSSLAVLSTFPEVCITKAVNWMEYVWKGSGIWALKLGISCAINPDFRRILGPETCIDWILEWTRDLGMDIEYGSKLSKEDPVIFSWTSRFKQENHGPGFPIVAI